MKKAILLLCFFYWGVQAYAQNHLLTITPNDNLRSILEDVEDDTKLLLSEGVYRITGNDKGLLLKNAKNISIIGLGNVSIVVDDGYKRVLTVDHCKDISLRNLSMTHDVAQGDCDAAVIQITHSDRIQVLNCKLDGSGTMAAEIMSSAVVEIIGGEATHNTEGVFWIEESNRVTIKQMEIYNNTNVNWGGLPAGKNPLGMGILNMRLAQSVYFEENNIHGNSNRYFMKSEQVDDFNMKDNLVYQNTFKEKDEALDEVIAEKIIRGQKVVEAGTDLRPVFGRLQDGETLILKEGNYYIESENFATGLTLSGSKNVTIKAEGDASIIANSNQHRVLTIDNCEGITIEGIHMTHNIEKGHCDSPVLHINQSSNILLDRADLNGSGMHAVEVMESKQITVQGGAAYFNTVGVFLIQQSEEVVIDGVYIYGNSNYNWGRPNDVADAPFGYGILDITDSKKVTFKNNTLLGNENIYFKKVINSTEVAVMDNYSGGNYFAPTPDLPVKYGTYCFVYENNGEGQRLEVMVDDNQNATGLFIEYDEISSSTYDFTGSVKDGFLTINYLYGEEKKVLYFQFNYYSLSLDDSFFKEANCGD